MIIEPKVREYICTTAHPVGCAESVRRQAEAAASAGEVSGPERVLVIGCSTGYGLASRISALVNLKAATLGIMFERPAAGKRTATAGWYNTAAFEQLAKERGLYARSINGDAFSREIKEKTIRMIQEDLGTVDLVVYSLAAPRRTDEEGITWSSCLKTTGESYTEKSLDLRTGQIVKKTIATATEEEIQGTVKVMGGEDWCSWIDALKEADVLAPGAVTVAYSYIGPELTFPIYYHGTIGAAKQHLHSCARLLDEKYPDLRAYISVNKGLVTQASAAIPVVPLYFSILYRIMKEKGTHEGCIQQISRLFTRKLFPESGQALTDENGYIRMDDLEMNPRVQEQVRTAWGAVNTENMADFCDVEGYWEDFYHMFGFHYDNVDYSVDVNPDVPIPSLSE